MMLFSPFNSDSGIFARSANEYVLSTLPLIIPVPFGFLSLFGIAVLDGVILISFINKANTDDEALMKDAMVEGASLRVRPVLMTALLSGLGLSPAALSHAIGSEAQRPLALVIVGGMISTTALTLLVLPVIYAWFKSLGNSAAGLV